MVQAQLFCPNECFSTIQHVWACIAPDSHRVMAKKLAQIQDYVRRVIHRAFAAIATRVKGLLRKTGARIHIRAAGSARVIRVMTTDPLHFVNQRYVRVVTAGQAKPCALDVIKWAVSVETLMRPDSAAIGAKQSMNRAGVATKERYEIPA